MLLSELSPKWLTPNLLTFLCPHCKKDWLTVKNAVISSQEQFDIYEKEFGEDWNMKVVPCNPSFAWSISGDIGNLTVNPSVDASASGHWHGFVTNGAIC